MNFMLRCTSNAIFYMYQAVVCQTSLKWYLIWLYLILCACV